MEIDKNHDQSRYSNQTLHWLPSDTKELWLKNCKNPTNWDYFKRMGWIEETAITYTFNKQGFRSPEFIDCDNFVALGCSFTVGTGLPYETVWPSVLGKETNLVPYNLGVYGCSLDTCYRLARYYIPKLKPKFVVVLPPPATRFEIFVDNRYQTIMFDHKKYESFVKAWFFNDQNMFLHFEKVLGALETLCIKNNCKLYIIPELKADDDARDLKHQGPQTHKNAIEDFLKTTDL